MKIAIKHQSLLKIFNGLLSYESVLSFASQEFRFNAESCCLTYTDDEGDEITIASAEDFTILVELYKDKPLVEINIKKSESKELIEITDHSQSNLKDGFEQLEDKRKEDNVDKKQQLNDKQSVAGEKKNQNTADGHKQDKHQGHYGHGHHRNHGHHKHHGNPWNKGHSGHHPYHRSHRNSESSNSHDQRRLQRMQHLLNEKIAHQVDERIKVLIPCLQNQLNPQNPIKLFSVPNPLIHPNSECKGCVSSPIIGIRYKCLKCLNFSLCEKCQATIEHPHNLIKMKFIQESEVNNMPWPQFKGWGKCSYGKRSHSKSKDCQFWGGKKANKLAKIFGGLPEEYKEFISANKDLHLGETISKFAKENNKDFKGYKFNKSIEKLCKFFDLPQQKAQKYFEQNWNLKPKQLVQKYAKENNISQGEINQKRINFKCQKMGKFFEKEPESFRPVVSANLDLRPYQLKRLIMEQQFSQRYQNSTGCPFLQKQGQKSSEQKKEKIHNNWRDKRELHQQKKRKDTSAKKEDILKSNILKSMVQYFGTDKINEYQKLIDEHFSEGQEKIIQLYLEHINH